LGAFADGFLPGDCTKEDFSNAVPQDVSADEAASGLPKSNEVTTGSFKARFYESYASTHTLHRKPAPTAEGFAAKAGAWDARLGSLLPPEHGARIIDVGCGSGSLVWWLQARGYENAQGIDVSAEQVELALSAGVRHVSVADLRPWLSAHPGTYDLIFLRDVIEHFDRSDTVELLELVRTSLSGGGRVVLQVPNAESPFFGRVRYGDFTHEMAYTPTSLTQLFGVVGLAVERFMPVVPVIPRARTLPRYALWKAVEFFYRVLGFAEGGEFSRIVTQNLIAVGRVR